MEYDAFISYRHVERDAAVAGALQRALEHYHIPAQIQKQTGIKKIRRVFRDREELSTNTDLAKTLDDALDHSKFLIVICSPDAKASQWVNREVSLFLETHSMDKVLLLLTDGEPSSAFPERVFYDEKKEKDADGNENVVRVPIEPMAADVRAETDSDRLKKLKTEKLRLIADMLSCRFDDLKQRDREYRIRRAAFIGAGAAALAAAFIIFMIRENSILQAQYRAKQINESRYLSTVSDNLLQQGDRMAALEVAKEALPESEENLTRPITGEAVYALNNALRSYTYSNSDVFTADTALKMDNLPNTSMKGACSMSPSGLFCGVVDSGDVISIFDVKAEEKKASITSAVLSQDGENADSESLPIEGFAMISDTQFVLVTEEEAACIDFLTASPVWERKFTAEEANSYVAGLCFAVNQDASRLAISGPTMMDSFLVLDTATGEILTEKTSLSDASNASDAFITKLVINPSGNRFAFGITRILSASSVPGLTVYDLTEDRFTEEESCRTNIAEMVFADDDRLMTMEYSKTSDSTSGTSSGTSDSTSGTSSGTSDGTSADQVYSGAPSFCCYDTSSGKEAWRTQGPSIDLQTDYSCIRILKMEGDAENGSTVFCCADNYCFILNGSTGKSVTAVMLADNILGVEQFSDTEILIGTVHGKVVKCSFSDNYATSLAGSLDDSRISSFAYSEATGDILQLKAESNELVLSSSRQDDSFQKLNLDEDMLPAYATYMMGIDKADGIYRCVIAFSRSDPTRSLLYVWKTGETKVLAVIPNDSTKSLFVSEEGKYSFFVYTDPDGSTGLCYRTYTSAENESDTLHFYSFASQSEVWSLSLGQEKDGQTVNPSLCPYYNSGKRYLLLYRGTSFGIMRLDDRQWVLPYEERKENGVFEFTDVNVSSSGRYLVFSTTKDMNQDGRESYCEKIWDTEENAWTEEEYPSTDSSPAAVGNQSDIAAFYQGNEIQIISLETGKTLQKIPFSGVNRCQMNFLLDDRYLLTWGDSGYLESWDVKSGERTDQDSSPIDQLQALLIDGDPSYFAVLIKKQENDSGEDSRVQYVYSLSADGTFSRYANVGLGITCASAREILNINPSTGEIGIFRFKTLDELLDLAKTQIGDRTLTDEEKARYYIGQ